MGALACMLHDVGHEVRGSDGALYPPMSHQLERAHILVNVGFSPTNLAWGPDCVVVGNVCSRDHIEVAEARRLGLSLESMPSLFARILLPGRRSIVVAGTHGKTTTASLLAWMLRCGDTHPSWLIGGVPVDLGGGGHVGSGKTIVIEGDEYDTAYFDKRAKFFHYRPSAAILTSVEFDHADIYDDMEAVRTAFREFVELIEPTGYLVVHAADLEAMAAARHARCMVVTYRVHEGDVSASALDSADYVATSHTPVGARRTAFRIYERGASLGQFSTLLVGAYNLANLTAAVAVARAEGCEVAMLAKAIADFHGVQRRQELVGTAQGVRVVVDFAHHPTAARLTVGAIRRRHPEKTLHVCFEPRSASSRRAAFFDDYVQAFDHAGRVYIGPLHAPEKIAADERLDTKALAEGLRGRGIEAQAFERVEEMVDAVITHAGPGDSVLVLSSGGFGGLADGILEGLGDPVMLKRPEDVPAIDALLGSYGLPALVGPESVHSLVIRGRDELVGCVHLELAGRSAYFFGLAVVPSRRGEGLGWVLADSVLRYARTLGARRVYLLPGDSADFFAGKLGFGAVAINAVDPAVRGCSNFAGVWAEAARCMVCELPDEIAES